MCKCVFLFAVVGLLVGTALSAPAQTLKINQPWLNIGDPAPKLTVEKFLLGEPVTNFEKGKVYIVEFTGRYCLACQSAIPHLAELQKKYPDVIVISVYIGENLEEVPQFVKKNRERMRYRVAVDLVRDGQDPSNGAMRRGWWEAAGQNAIPMAFIVDGGGKIAWIGYVDNIEDSLTQIRSGEWDLESAAAKFKAKRNQAKEFSKNFAKLSETEKAAVATIQRAVGGRSLSLLVGEQSAVIIGSPDMTDSLLQEIGKALLELKGLVALDFRSSSVTDAGLRHLGGLQGLKTLNLSHTRVTDAGLKELRALHELTSIKCDHTLVTGEGMKYLQSLPRFETLSLNGSPVTDAGLKEVQSFKTLHELDVENTLITDAGLKYLQRLKTLQQLKLGGTRVTGAGLRELRDLTNLKNLWLSRTRVGDFGLKELQGMKRLAWLDLTGTQVTDAGLRDLCTALKQLRGPKWLLLADTRVTDKGARELLGVKELCYLNLDDTQVGDAGLIELLHGLKGLQGLSLAGTRVTNASLAALKQACKPGVDLSRTKMTNKAVKDLIKACPDANIIH